VTDRVAAIGHDAMRADFRPALSDDIDRVLAFWQRSTVSTSTDSAEALTALLDRDPGALILAEDRGEIVGTVIAGWDGWRGSIYRLAVARAHRRHGLGAGLLRAAEARLSRLGARRMHAIVVGTDTRAVAFWDATDWEHQEGQVRYAK
jgi:ribosomal protein S18 acetylase RimI-like enzyme